MKTTTKALLVGALALMALLSGVESARDVPVKGKVGGPYNDQKWLWLPWWWWWGDGWGHGGWGGWGGGGWGGGWGGWGILGDRKTGTGKTEGDRPKTNAKPGHADAGGVP